MDLKKLIEDRYSVRAYLPKSVEKEKIEYVLECARLSPSACNYQPWYFYVVTDKAMMEKIYPAYHREWFKTAPMCIVVCKDTNQSWKRTATDNKDFADVDAAISSEHICLAAHSIGLGTCWICNFDLKKLTEALDIPNEKEAIAIFPLGYIDEEKSYAPEKKRKTLSEITDWK